HRKRILTRRRIDHRTSGMRQSELADVVRTGYIDVVLGKVTLLTSGGVIEQRHALTAVATRYILLIAWIREGCQDADDRNDNHQFDQGETIDVLHNAPFQRSAETGLAAAGPYDQDIALLHHSSPTWRQLWRP